MTAPSTDIYRAARAIERDRDALRAAKRRVEKIHTRELNTITNKYMCRECFAEYPCPTVEALRTDV